MSLRRSQVILASVCLGMAVCGCHSGDGDYKVWAQKPIEYVPKDDSQNAYDTYALAAEDVETATKSYRTRTFFFPGQRAEIVKKTADSVKKVAEATNLPCHFEFVAHGPFQLPKYQVGWRMIGRVFQWNVENACLKGDFDKAIQNAVTGTIFGFDLSGGGATDASVGLSVADDVRKAIAPYLTKMSPRQLDRLAREIKDALVRKPSIADAVEHERSDMIQTIQYIQDRVKDDKVKTLADDMGPDVYEVVKFLNEIRGSNSKRTEFFNELEKDGEDEFAEVLNNVEQPVSKRQHTKRDYPGQWKKLPKHVFGSARPLLEINDATVARTRLLILYSEILKFDAEGKPYPESLSVFSKDLTIDPYSGNPFVYHPETADFKLYSVGANCRDDGGQTDETYTSPDLTLEVPSS